MTFRLNNTFNKQINNLEEIDDIFSLEPLNFKKFVNYIKPIEKYTSQLTGVSEKYNIIEDKNFRNSIVYNINTNEWEIITLR